MPLKVITQNKPAELIASFQSWTRIHLQVRDANTVYFSRSRVDIETPGPQGLQQGIAIQQASGIISLPWIGPLYMYGSAPNCLIQIEIFPEGVNLDR